MWHSELLIKMTSVYKQCQRDKTLSKSNTKVIKS